MGRAVPPATEPTAAQLEEMHRRKDRAALAISSAVHQAWALSWLATFAFEAPRTDYSASDHQEAAHVALELVTAKLAEAKSLHDAGYSGTYRAVMDGKGDAP
ncbi:hypothetical protein [Methylobacterium platani]|uniref:Uncharacterized protein n=2 Tax=Methylobacterium platani TaxID=427683 RepID=A0A179SKC7_9HYPH|nr:hypothetical protein [Methylobacterium platani]KMO16521.1 hypothetical protein SQ03_14565 [Methylobacterium platani JCM 14648]OAS27460.1 hypothetical protein A5481_01475 [Methylobacterium platani]